MKPKLAFCFRGMCKNFHPLHEMYKKNLFDPISEVYDIDFYLSSSKATQFASAWRNGENCEVEWDSILKYISFKNSIVLEENDEGLKEVMSFAKHMASGGLPVHGAHLKYDEYLMGSYGTFKNLYHIQLLQNLVKDEYQKYIITRQDLLFFNKINLEVFNSSSDIAVPRSHNTRFNEIQFWEGKWGYTDRFAIINNYKSFLAYTNRFEKIRQKEEKYHEEGYLKKHLDREQVSVSIFDNFYFTAVRADEKNVEKITTNALQKDLIKMDEKTWDRTD